MEWIIWEPFYVGLGKQQMHLDIICCLCVTQEICQHNPKLCTNKYSFIGMMVDPSANTLHMNGLKHTTLE
jgi:hypothetical protein